MFVRLLLSLYSTNDVESIIEIVNSNFDKLNNNNDELIFVIYDVLGNRVERFTAKNYQSVVDCSSWEKGLYFIKSINETGKDKISKLIVD